MADYTISNGELYLHSEHTSRDELRHYGVVGMKWGVRRAKKKGTTYSYKSHATKVYEKKADKFNQKGDATRANRYKQYAEKSAGLDKKVQSYAETMSSGKAFVQTALLYNTRTYASTKNATGSRGLALLNSFMLGGIGDMLARALYVRGYDDAYFNNVKKAAKAAVDKYKS